MLIYQYLLLLIAVFKFSFADIGDLTVRKSSPLVLNKWKHDECSKLLPHTGSCDNAYKVVDEYCEEQAKKIDRNCDETYEKLKISCNAAEKKIKEDCKASDGYVTAKCGRKFDRLGKVCKIASETISRTCTQKYKRLDDICSRKYSRNDLKCNRIYKQYEDLCETNLEENVRYDIQSKENLGLEDVEEKVDELSKVKEWDFNDKAYLENKPALKVDELSKGKEWESDDKAYLENKPALKVENKVKDYKKLSSKKNSEKETEDLRKSVVNNLDDESFESNPVSKNDNFEVYAKGSGLNIKYTNLEDTEKKAVELNKRIVSNKNPSANWAEKQVKKHVINNYADLVDSDFQEKNPPTPPKTVEKPKADVKPQSPSKPANNSPQNPKPEAKPKADVKPQSASKPTNNPQQKPKRKLFSEKYDNSRPIQFFKKHPSRTFLSDFQRKNLVKESFPVSKSLNADDHSLTRKSFLKDLLHAIDVEKKKFESSF